MGLRVEARKDTENEHVDGYVQPVRKAACAGKRGFCWLKGGYSSENNGYDVFYQKEAW